MYHLFNKEEFRLDSLGANPLQLAYHSGTKDQPTLRSAGLTSDPFPRGA